MNRGAEQEKEMSQSGIAMPTIDEEYHRGQEAKIATFSYTKPTDYKGKNKVISNLGRTDIVRGLVHVLREGGETNLHYHTKIDSLWFVLKGRVRFYGPGDVLQGEFGPHEGIFMPRGARYWFESASEEEVELLHVSAYSEAGAEGSGRTDAAPRKRAVGETPHFEVNRAG
jgi:mannose-6-phosphate isomerase-like protein (cupin superfamily)